MSMRWTALLLLVLVSSSLSFAEVPAPQDGAAASPAADVTNRRSTLSLEGTWRRAEASASDETPPATSWRDQAVPGTTHRTPTDGSKCFWYERELSIPADLGDRRVFLDLRGARNAPKVYIDGKFIGAGSDGWSPTVVELTSAVHAGGTHKLTVRLQDRGVFFREGFTLAKGMRGAEIRWTVLNPIGGHHDCIGFWDRVLLQIVPASFIDSRELSIVTSTRKGTLHVTGYVASAKAGASVVAEVLDGERVALSLPPATVGADGRFSIDRPFPDAKYWSPESPNLYALRLTLRQGEASVDVYSTRFGFKEIWTDGPDLYLNGVKRRLLASSTWPRSEFEDAAEIRKRVENIRANNVVAFRLHTGAWQEAWLDAADELGLLIIDEAAVYTDGEGFYCYDDPRFWQNYQKHVEGMIRRDRNRASLAMWSLGNEILFMGNANRATDLPKKLGDLARAARSFDPTHLFTFEADLDPDGAYDVIGLHYPHEMPAQRAYPNITDWLGERKDTEAGGGMLGQQGRSGFLWRRDKPLYIGEYLWVPQNDYSCGTIWFGDEAFLNRHKFHNSAQYLSWHDQSVAYRRAGVTGLCPWTVFGFGGVASPTAEAYLLQKDYYEPIAAFWRTRALRFFGGDTAKIEFDVFNDGPTPLSLDLTLGSVGDSAGGLLAQSKAIQLEPAGHQTVTLEVKLPSVESTTDLNVESALLANGKAVHSAKRVLRIEPRRPIVAPAGHRLVVLDPNGKWPASVRALKQAGPLVPERDLLLIANDIVTGPAKSGVPVIGQDRADLADVRSFLLAGGRVVVLEQGDVSALGLGVVSSERASTMTFAIDPTHPVLKGLRAEDLSYWAPDNFVTSQEMSRPTAGGATAVTITGGEGWMKFSPIIELPFGKGRAVFVQALAGAKRDVEPAAARLIQNAIDYLASLPPAREVLPVRVIGADETAERSLRGVGVQLTTDASKASADALVLVGGDVAGAREAIESVLSRGGTVYWRGPTPETFASLSDVLGGTGLKIEPITCGLSIHDRANPLMRGVSRGDLIRTTALSGWDKRMTWLPTAARSVIAATAAPSFEDSALASLTLKEGATRPADESAVVFASNGEARLTVDRPAAGVYAIAVGLQRAEQIVAAPVFQITANGVEIGAFPAADAKSGSSIQVPLRAGSNELSLRLVSVKKETNADAPKIAVGSIRVTQEPVVPRQVTALTIPAAVATWSQGAGRVVIDGVTWDQPWEGPADPRCYASALLSNLGLPMAVAKAAAPVEVVPLSSLKLVGESSYFTRSADQLECNSNAIFEATIECETAGRFRFQMNGRGTPCKGEYPKVTVQIDGKTVGAVSTGPKDEAPLRTEAIAVSAGRHVLRLVYDNDQLGDGEDRNLVVRQVGFTRE